MDRFPHQKVLKRLRLDSSNSTLVQALAEIKPDLLLRDSGSTSQEEVEKICEIVPSVIHFDDFGEAENPQTSLSKHYIPNQMKKPRSLC